MAWTDSRVFRATIEDILEQVTAIDLDGDTFKAALYNSTPVPDFTVASASTAYNTGQWVQANEVYDTTNWDQGGEPLTGVTFGTAGAGTAILMFDATNTPQSGTTCTLANVYGTLVYSDTRTTPVADQGLSYHYFGGVQSVTGGTMTLVWHANGLFRLSF